MWLRKSIPEKLFLWPIECFIICVTFVLGIVDVIILLVREISVDWFSYGILLVFGNAFLALGWFCRSIRGSERVSLTMIAIGICISFTVTLSILNFLLLPLWREPLDSFLIQIDTLFGYSWPVMLDFAGHHPFFNELTRYAYLSSLPQLGVLILILGVYGKQKELHVLLLAITITAFSTLGFWALFPTFGTSTVYEIPSEIEQAATPLVGTDYGEKLLGLGAMGPTYITPEDTEGLVAFPSHHTTMAVLATYTSRTIRWLFPIIFVVNLFVLPGVLIHGGHHLIDVWGGLLSGCLGIYLARNFVVEKDIQPDRELVAAKPHSPGIHRREERS